jgi:hypothetical protein
VKSRKHKNEETKERTEDTEKNAREDESEKRMGEIKANRGILAYHLNHPYPSMSSISTLRFFVNGF